MVFSFSMLHDFLNFRRNNLEELKNEDDNLDTRFDLFESSQSKVVDLMQVYCVSIFCF